MLPANLPDIKTAKLPQIYQSAKTALAECSRIDECQSWANKAEALASYAKQMDDEELLDKAQRIKVRAIRRCGELLKEIEAAQGGQPHQHKDVNPTPGDIPPSRTQASVDPDDAEPTDRLTQMVLPGYEYLQVAYLIPRDGQQHLVAVADMTDEEIEAKADEHQRFAKGNEQHAEELRRYKVERKRPMGAA